MLNIVFHPDVEHEVKGSYEWYENQATDLGGDFLTELEMAYQAIAELPDTWPKFQNNFRRHLLRKFPFSVIYRLRQNTIFVVAIMHNSRKPGYWSERI